MDERLLPLRADLWARAGIIAHVPVLEQFAALHAEKPALQARIQDREAHLGQTSATSL